MLFLVFSHICKLSLLMPILNMAKPSNNKVSVRASNARGPNAQVSDSFFYFWLPMMSMRADVYKGANQNTASLKAEEFKGLVSCSAMQLYNTNKDYFDFFNIVVQNEHHWWL